VIPRVLSIILNCATVHGAQNQWRDPRWPCERLDRRRRSGERSHQEVDRPSSGAGRGRATGQVSVYRTALVYTGALFRIGGSGCSRVIRVPWQRSQRGSVSTRVGWHRSQRRQRTAVRAGPPSVLGDVDGGASAAGLLVLVVYAAAGGPQSDIRPPLPLRLCAHTEGSARLSLTFGRGPLA
jgi:hypothetical protein